MEQPEQQTTETSKPALPTKAIIRIHKKPVPPPPLDVSPQGETFHEKVDEKSNSNFVASEPQMVKRRSPQSSSQHLRSKANVSAASSTDDYVSQFKYVCLSKIVRAAASHVIQM